MHPFSPVENAGPSTAPTAAHDAAPGGQPIQPDPGHPQIDAGSLSQTATVNPRPDSPSAQASIRRQPVAHDNPATAALLSQLRSANPSADVSGTLHDLVTAAPAEHRAKFVELLSKEDPAALSRRLADLAGDDPVAASRAAFAFIQHAQLSAALGLDARAPDMTSVCLAMVGKDASERVPAALSPEGIALGRELACDALALLGEHSPQHAFWLRAAPSLEKISRNADGPLCRAVSATPGPQRRETALAAVAWWVSVQSAGDHRLAALAGADPVQAWNAALTLGLGMASSGADQQQGLALELHAAFERLAQAVSSAAVSASREGSPLQRELARDARLLTRQHAPAHSALRTQEPAAQTSGPADPDAPGVLRRLVEALPPERQRFAALTLAFSGHLIEGDLHALRNAPDEAAASAAFNALAHNHYVAYGVVVHGSGMPEARIGLQRKVSLAEQALHAEVAQWPAGDPRFTLAAEARQLLEQCLSEDDPARALRACWRAQSPSLGRAQGSLHDRVQAAATLPASERVARILEEFRSLSRNQEPARH